MKFKRYKMSYLLVVKINTSRYQKQSVEDKTRPTEREILNDYGNHTLSVFQKYE